MKSKVLNNGMDAMLGEQGNLCVSVIVPVHRTTAVREQDPVQVSKAVDEAIAVLDLYAKNQKLKTASLKKKLLDLYKTVDFMHTGEGLGLFVSDKVARVEHFPFPVKKRVVAGASFEVRDLMYKNALAREYYVLMLSAHNIHLFRGSLDRLEEVKDANFPKIYSESYEYAKPSRGSSTGRSKSTEGDKSQKQQNRLETFFRSADNALNSYAINGVPFFVAAVKKEIALFAKVSKHADRLAGKIEGNFEHTFLRKLEVESWKKMKALLDRDCDAELKKLNKMPSALIASGLREVWSDASEGKGLELFVEKDFFRRGFLDSDAGQLRLTAPKKKDRHILVDAVDDVIETVLKKNGKVQFVEAGKLEEHGGVALLKRF